MTTSPRLCRPDTDDEFGMVGSSTAIRTLRAQVVRAARLRVAVLVTGETGSGKELVARALHTASSRRDAPFVTVNCAALTTSMLSAELFGFERGSFTGAAHDHAGLFEQARQGTLFLDEIADLPLPAQSALLRVLDSGAEVRRVGGNRVMRVDVRVVAATNVDLRGEVDAGRFRGDLLQRLDCLRILVPPLRDRLDDIPHLSEHFLRVLEPDLGPRSLAPGVLPVLAGYAWPGNVRELGAVLTRAAVATDDRVIDAAGIAAAIAPSSGSADANPRPYIPRVVRPPITDETIHATLIEHNGNISAAARALGIPRSSLRDRAAHLRAVDRSREAA